MARQVVKDNAIVLRRSDFSETSQVATLFAEQAGKVSALAKGSKRPKNRSFGGGLELLTAGAAVLRIPASGGMALLTEWATTDTFAPLRGRLESLYAAYYLAELVDRLTEQLDPHPQVFAALRRSLGSLAAAAPTAPVLLAFEYYVLRVLGMLPNLRQCVCGRAVPDGRTAQFSPDSGALVCGKCDHRPPGRVLPIAPRLREGFEAIRRGPVLAAAEQLPARQADAMSQLLRHYITAVLGRPLKTYRYLPEPGA